MPSVPATARRTVGRLPAGLLSLTLPRVTTPLPRVVFLPPPFLHSFPDLILLTRVSPQVFTIQI